MSDKLFFKAQLVNCDQPDKNGVIYSKECLEKLDFKNANTTGFHITNTTSSSKGIEIEVMLEADSSVAQFMKEQQKLQDEIILNMAIPKDLMEGEENES